MKINLVICTYSGIQSKYNNSPEKGNFLRYNLQTLKTNKIDQITIMKPKVSSAVYPGYYSLDNIDLNIKDKIKIIECENLGISYGQFIKAIETDPSFDYYIFLEDDYIPFRDDFVDILIKEYIEGSYLCLFYYKNKKFDLIGHCLSKGESTDVLRKEIKDLSPCHIPDFSIGIISGKDASRIANKYDIMKIPFVDIDIYQILFGYLLREVGLGLKDLSQEYMTLFYMHWNRKISNLGSLGMPLFIPLESIVYNIHDQSLKEISSSLEIFWNKLLDLKKLISGAKPPEIKSPEVEEFVFCIPLWNRGRDIKMLLDNIEEIVQKTKEKIKVTITDFESTDIDFKILKYSYPIEVFTLKGSFNIGLAIQNCIDNLRDDQIAIICDADTGFVNYTDLFAEFRRTVIKGSSFAVPIVATESNPKKWRAKYDEVNKFYVPLECHGGCGFIVAHSLDLKNSGGLKNSPFVGSRGTKWGPHDDFLMRALLKNLHRVRNIEPRIWIRKNDRSKSNPWYDTDGGNYHDS